MFQSCLQQGGSLVWVPLKTSSSLHHLLSDAEQHPLEQENSASKTHRDLASPVLFFNSRKCKYSETPCTSGRMCQRSPHMASEIHRGAGPWHLAGISPPCLSWQPEYLPLLPAGSRELHVTNMAGQCCILSNVKMTLYDTEN